MSEWFAYLDHEGPIPFAHRGGASDWPENTVAAFAEAVKLGYRYLETDVHATRDAVLLAFHDRRLDRVTDHRGVISEMPYAAVREAKVDGREPIPLLEELLAAFPAARLNIDVKSDAAVNPLIEVLQRTRSVDRVCVGSFSDTRLKTIRRAIGPTLCTSLGPKEVARLRLASWRLPIPVPTAPCVQVPVRQGPFPICDSTLVRKAHSGGVAVHVWTIDDEPTMNRMLDLGVDGIMTDRPALLKSVFERRGLWHSF